MQETTRMGPGESIPVLFGDSDQARLPMASCVLGQQRHTDKPRAVSRDPCCPVVTGTQTHFGGALGTSSLLHVWPKHSNHGRRSPAMPCSRNTTLIHPHLLVLHVKPLA